MEDEAGTNTLEQWKQEMLDGFERVRRSNLGDVGRIAEFVRQYMADHPGAAGAKLVLYGDAEQDAAGQDAVEQDMIERNMHEHVGAPRGARNAASSSRAQSFPAGNLPPTGQHIDSLFIPLAQEINLSDVSTSTPAVAVLCYRDSSLRIHKYSALTSTHIDAFISWCDVSASLAAHQAPLYPGVTFSPAFDEDAQSGAQVQRWWAMEVDEVAEVGAADAADVVSASLRGLELR